MGKKSIKRNKNIICVPFAYKANMQSGENVSSSGNQRLFIYLKNASVALISAKHFNKDADVILATSLLEHEIPEEIRKVLKREDIKIITIPYDEFCFSSEYTWSLAFYKLCVLKHLCNVGFEKVVYLDTDVYIQGNFESIWKEVEQKILLYDINHGLNVEDYRSFCNEVKIFNNLNNQMYITHYGGEFFASNYKNAIQFMALSERIYEEMVRKEFKTSKGDEFILSLAANEMKDDIKNAGAYIYRFWTGARFRLVSTCYENNKVLILHLPAEKEKGMIRLYSNYIRKGSMPSEQKVWKICRLKHRTFLDYIGYIVITFLKKIRKSKGEEQL